MIDQELLGYIKTQLDRGVSQEAIKKSLLENNWTTESIDEAFYSIENSPVNTNITPEINSLENQNSINYEGYQDRGKIGRSFLLVKESIRILRQDKEIMWFPVISSITVLLINAVFIFIAFSSKLLAGESTNNNSYLFYGLLFIFYLVTYFIVAFFNTGLVTCANIRLNGGDPTFKDGIDNAKKHINKIFTWALLAATVGIVLQIISDKSRWVGKIVTSLLNVTWSLATFFIVPVIIFEDQNVIDSVKESGSLFVKTWGENVVGQISMSISFTLIALLGLIPLGLAIITLKIGIIIAAAIIVIGFWILLGIISASLDGIYKTALYNYARSGKVVAGYSPDIFQTAFAPKK